MKVSVSIIIRSYNEERWIGACLKAIGKQRFQDYEIILVDNNSSDYTVSIASKFSKLKTVDIQDFLPGYAINLGIENSVGEYIVCLSAHCIPTNEQWLENLIEELQDPKVAGVYGRQIPVSFTPDVDKRDLFTIFGPESRRQRKDGFFHNANSAIKRSVWERIRFNDQATNIEDRIWGKEIIEAGLELAYCADAAVFHYHGVNQGNTNVKRLKGIVTLIQSKNLAGMLDFKDLPVELTEQELDVPFVLTISRKEESQESNLIALESRIKELRLNFKNPIIVLTNSSRIVNLDIEGYYTFRKSDIERSDDLSIFQLLVELKFKLAYTGFYPYAFVYLNFKYLTLSYTRLGFLLSDSLYRGLELSFMALKDFSHIWRYNEGRDSFESFDFDLRSREHRMPNYRAVYGQGMFILCSVLKEGLSPEKLKTGIIELMADELSIEKL